MNEKIEALKSSFDSELKKIANMVDLEALRVNYLGRKGKVTDALKGMGGLTDEQKKTVGRETNELKTAITVALAEKLEALKAQELQREINALPEFDISMPPDMTRGSYHPITLVQRQCEQVFKSMGFTVEDYAEVVTDYECFESLNIPKFHPARDMQDTYYLDNGQLLKTQTSAAQNAIYRRYRDALALIKKENPFPAVCGRVCNRRCEDACTRGTVDQAVAIDAVKKFIAEQDLNAAHRYVPDVVQPSLQGPWPQKIAIIGGGPAGLSCAYFLAVQGYKPTVFEKNERPGGMLRYGIPSFKLEKNVIDAEIDILRELGVDIRCGVEVGKDVTLAELRRQGYRAFYIAIGCQGGRRAGVPGEDAAGIETAVHLLRTVGGDESRKMTGKTVVIGGGNVAIDAARVSLRCGSDDVTMVCLEPRDKMPASPEEIAEAEEEGAKITYGYGPKEFLSENGHVTAVVLKKCTGLYNAEGRFAPTYDENDTITLPCDNVVLSIGQCIEWGDLLNGEAVQLGRGQGAVADALTYQTAQPDIFVGGDVCTGPRFAIDAIAAGKQGAISIHRFVQPNTSLTIGRNRRDFHELDKANLALGEYDRAPRQSAALDAGIDAHRSFRDAHLTLTEDQVKLETARCLGCGASVVDPNKCIGCGVCTTKCEFDAIRLHRDLPECSKMVRSEDKFKAILPYMAKREIKIRFGKKEK